MIVIGLTGSIGMGKSTTAGLFAEEGAAVWDADAAVHRLYAPEGAAVGPVLDAFPEAGLDDMGIDRKALADIVLDDSEALRRLEAIVHPLVAEDRRLFLKKAEAGGFDIAVLDIPLLAESGSVQDFREVVVTTAPEDVRRRRVLARPGMTEAKLDAILKRQAPEVERLSLATHVVDTGRGIEPARAQVRDIMRAVREKHGLSKGPAPV